MSEPAVVGQIFWDKAERYGWRTDEGGWMTNVFRLRSGEIIEIYTMGTDENGGVVIKEGSP